MRLDEARRTVRPLWLAVLTTAGAWWVAFMVHSYPWHHFMAAWVAGALMAAYGAFGLYREIRNRVIVARWVRLLDNEKAAASMEIARRAASRLPARHRNGFAAKKKQVEAEIRRPGARAARRRSGEPRQ